MRINATQNFFTDPTGGTANKNRTNSYLPLSIFLRLGAPPSGL